MAGLGNRLEIEMRKNEISIRTAHETNELQIQPSEEVWNIFRTLGDEAVRRFIEMNIPNKTRLRLILNLI
ncbi:MAG: hypothetical protein AB7S75_04740 [Desulfococcaceae bacterium]